MRTDQLTRAGFETCMVCGQVQKQKHRHCLNCKTPVAIRTNEAAIEWTATHWLEIDGACGLRNIRPLIRGLARREYLRDAGQAIDKLLGEREDREHDEGGDATGRGQRDPGSSSGPAPEAESEKQRRGSTGTEEPVETRRSGAVQQRRGAQLLERSDRFHGGVSDQDRPGSRRDDSEPVRAPSAPVSVRGPR